MGSKDRIAAVVVALGVAAFIGGLILLRESTSSEAKPNPSGTSTFLVMIQNDAVGRACKLLQENDIRITFMCGSRSTQLQVAEEDVPRATELLSRDALEGIYFVSFSGYLGNEKPQPATTKHEKSVSEILKDPEGSEGTPLGEVLRHAVIRHEAQTFPIVTETESLVYEPDPTSTRTSRFLFFRIRLAKEDRNGESRVLYYQFKEGGRPIQVSERYYRSLPKRARE